jgi:hypothetical protein
MKSSPIETRALRAALLLAAGLAAGLALAGCQTDSTGKPVAQAAAPEPLDHQQAALKCWMETEHGHADLPLDKRADVVDACIKAKMAGQPWPSAGAKAKAKKTKKAKKKSQAKAKPKAQPTSQAEPKT